VSEWRPDEAGTEKKTPSEWEVIRKIRVLDPDGWDRQNFAESWSTPITEYDFWRRAAESTIENMRSVVATAICVAYGCNEMVCPEREAKNEGWVQTSVGWLCCGHFLQAQAFAEIVQEVRDV